MMPIKFLKESFKDFRTVGAVAPSSKFLVKKMVRPINFYDSDCIVELGAGTGCVTKEILLRMNPDARLFSFELNKKFCEVLNTIDDARLTVINDSAEKINFYLKKNKMGKADCIISSLPLVSLPKKVKNKVINEVFSSLKPKKSYVQFQYSLASYSEFKKKFSDVKVDFTPLNVPPAFVYICKTSQ